MKMYLKIIARFALCILAAYSFIFLRNILFDQKIGYQFQAIGLAVIFFMVWAGSSPTPWLDDTKGKKYRIGWFVFWLNIFSMFFINTRFSELFFWAPVNTIFILLGSFFGFVSFKTDIDCIYEPYEESVIEYLFNSRKWWLWLNIIQIANIFIAGPGGNYFTDAIVDTFATIFGFEKEVLYKGSLMMKASVANMILCLIYVITAPIRRLSRIERMLLNDGKSDAFSEDD
jgi:hypothetical protein